MPNNKTSVGLRQRALDLFASDKERTWDAHELGEELGETVRRMAQELSMLNALGRIGREPVKRQRGSSPRPLFRYRFLTEPFDASELVVAVARMSADGPYRPSIQGEQR